MHALDEIGKDIFKLKTTPFTWPFPPDQDGELVRVSIQNGGSNYATGDKITLPSPGAALNGKSATLTVDAVDDNGAVTELSVTDGGAGFTLPARAILTGVTSGASSGSGVVVKVEKANPGPAFRLASIPRKTILWSIRLTLFTTDVSSFVTFEVRLPFFVFTVHRNPFGLPSSVRFNELMRATVRLASSSDCFLLVDARLRSSCSSSSSCARTCS